MRNLLKYLLGFLLAALLLWWVIAPVSEGGLGDDLREIRGPLAEASLWLLVVSLTLNLLHMVPRVWRWAILLEPIDPSVRFRPMFVAVTLGYTITWIIPGRIGELVRPALVSARERVPLGPCTGSVVADRILDGLTVVLLFATAASVGVPEATGDTGSLRVAAWAMIAAGGIGLGSLLLVSRYRPTLSSLAERSPRALRWVINVALAFAGGVGALRDPRLVVRLAGQSLLIWGTIAVSTWIGFLACGVEMSLAGVLLLMPVLALGAAVPTPGNIGGYQAAVATGLQMMFGVDPATAVSAGLLMHLSITVPTIALGLVLLKVEGLAWNDLIELGRQIRNLGSDPAGEASS